ncbi:MAG: hypothetical protein ACR2FY_25790 [Pirellulaceae bacterium]
MTTLLIDDELGQRARLAAECQGKTLDQFVGDVLRQAVAGKEIQIGSRNGLPVVLVPPGTPIIQPADVARALAEDDL